MEAPDSPSAEYFNNLSQRVPTDDASQSRTLSENNGAATAGSQGEGDGNHVPRPKRIACVVCRKRKLRCDGKKPSCGTCSRLGHDCAYDEVRKKSGPKRGYVKQLEARLAQVETLLKNHEPEPIQAPATQPQDTAFNTPLSNDLMQGMPDISMLADDIGSTIPSLTGQFGQTQPDQTGLAGANMGFNGDFSWEMVSLGLEEPLPAQDVIDELHQIYFDKVHPSFPMIHRPRYLAAMNLAPNTRPPVCLRYIIWCHAASITRKYAFLQEHFYQRARKYAELDEMRGQGESITTVAYSQTWTLIGAYEFRMLYFPRAWVSAGKAARLALMMGLHRLDGVGLDMKQCIAAPRDWTEKEERRRTFWMAFCQDRYASIGTGWPMMLDERDILTNLPASEEAYTQGKQQRTLPLSDLMTGEGASTLSSFGGVVLTASLFGRNLLHLHRPELQDNDHDLNGEFWKRHRAYDNVLLNTSLSLPGHLRLPDGLHDPNIVFCNMCIHTSTVCLHQAAIFKADKNQMPNQIAAESKRRCIIAADQIASIMKMISHTDLTTMNPFVCFPLYVASRVFVQYLKSRPDDQTVRSSLQFLLSALNALKHRNPLTESFLIQLNVDLVGTGLETPDIAVKTSCSMTKAKVCQQNAPNNPLYDETPVDTSEPPFLQSSIRNPTHLPSRQKQPGFQQLNVSVGLAGAGAGAEFQPIHRSSRNPSPGIDEGGMRMNADMDVSPDVSVSDRNHPPSDHPTPSTLNSSSNTSFTPSRADHPSPQKQQQPQQSNAMPSNRHTATSIGNSANPVSMSSNSSTYPTEVPSFSHYFSPDTGTPHEPVGSENPFSMPAAWDYPISQTPAANVEATVGGATGLTPTESQWAQMFDGPGWENWRT